MAVGLWGLAPVATRAAVTSLAPAPLLVLRLTIAALVLLPFAVPVLRRLRLRSLGRLAAAGALGLIGYNLPVTIGLQWLPASAAGLLLATEPVVSVTGAVVILREHLTPATITGGAVILAGVATANSRARLRRTPHPHVPEENTVHANASLDRAESPASGGHSGHDHGFSP